MRQTLFERIRDVPARFLSEAPLFDFAEGARPLNPGHYSLAGEATLTFAFDEDHYRMTGGAPETVVLIPIAGHAGIYIFQQSAGYGTAFYGLLRLSPGSRGFDLFSPEPLGLQAVDLAIGHGGIATDYGCAFGDPDMVRTTLLELGLPGPAGAWNSYQRV